MNSRLAIFTKKGKKYDTTGTVLYGAVPTNTVFAGFGGTCEARNNGDAVVRYDQLADRWLIVMPIFRRAAAAARSAAGVDARRQGLRQPAGRRRSARCRGEAVRAAARAATATGTRAPPAAPAAGGRGAAPPEEQGPYSMCYAISTSADPLGTYYRYEFLRPLFPDYPRPAVWPDGYYVPTQHQRRHHREARLRRRSQPHAQGRAGDRTVRRDRGRQLPQQRRPRRQGAAACRGAEHHAGRRRLAAERRYGRRRGLCVAVPRRLEGRCANEGDRAAEDRRSRRITTCATGS